LMMVTAVSGAAKISKADRGFRPIDGSCSACWVVAVHLWLTTCFRRKFGRMCRERTRMRNVPLASERDVLSTTTLAVYVLFIALVLRLEPKLLLQDKLRQAEHFIPHRSCTSVPPELVERLGEP